MPTPDGATRAGVTFRWVRDTPRVVWALVALQFSLSVLYAIAVPLFHAPDEHAHVDLALTAPGHLGLDPYANHVFDQRTFTAMATRHLDVIDWRSSPRQPWVGLDAADAPPRAERPTFEDLAPSGPVGQVNHTNTNPPLYYAALRVASNVVRAVLPVRWTWDREVTLLRMISASMVAPLPWLAFWAAMLIGATRRTSLAAAVVPVTIPQLAHGAGAVNNDTLVIALCGALTVVVLLVARGDRRARVAVAAGVLAGGASLTKVFGMAAPLWIAAAYAVAWRRGSSVRSVLGNLGLAAGATVAAGGWWVLGHLIRSGTAAPRAFLYPQPAAVETPLLPWLDEVSGRMSSTFWGNLGVEQFAIPGPLIVALTLTGLALLALGWTARLHHEPADDDLTRVPIPAPRWLALLPVGTTLAAALPAAWSGYERTGLPVGLHGRYLFVGLVGMSAVAALGARRVFSRNAPLVVFAAACLVQTFGLVTALRSYWVGDGLWGSVLAMSAWAPWQQRWTAALVIVVMASGAAAVVGLFRDPPPGPVAA